jgi:hypothetical protein
MKRARERKGRPTRGEPGLEGRAQAEVEGADGGFIFPIGRARWRFGDPADGVTVTEKGAEATFTVVGRIDGAQVEWRVDGAVVAQDVDTWKVRSGSSVAVKVTAVSVDVRVDDGDLSQEWRFTR